MKVKIFATVSNFSAQVERKYDKAARAGIVGAQQFLLNKIKEAYDEYYTTGEYRSTLQIRQAWRRSTPTKGPTGWSGIVGVPTAMVTPKGSKTAVDRGLVALYWEIGFNHADSGIRYHYPLAKPTAEKNVEGIKKAYASAFKTVMEMP